MQIKMHKHLSIKKIFGTKKDILSIKRYKNIIYIEN